MYFCWQLTLTFKIEPVYFYTILKADLAIA